MRRFWPALDLPVLLAILLCAMMGYATRNALNPDGVSYLDLAAILRAGDWGHFLQGYWSPLYPVLLGILQGITGIPQADFLPWAHGMDTALVVATILVIRFTAVRTNNIVFGLAGVPLVLLASGRLPRIEAVTPDVLLAFLLACIACEILTHRATRWKWLGILFGLAFLAKTSSWPWMIMAVGVAVLGAGSKEGRQAVLRVAGVGGLIALCWIVPLSVKYGTPTFGSSGRLNYCWYIKNCDSRTPDSHSGNHQRYLQTTFEDSIPVRIVEYADGPWSYEPWGDPTAWDRGIVGGYTYSSNQPWILGAWKDVSVTIRIWTVSVTIGILIPLLLVTFRRGMVGLLFREERPAALLMLIGLAGIAQFEAVHAEPRLIAPFVLTGGLGVIYWFTRTRPPDPSQKHPLLRFLPGLGAGWIWGLLLGINFADRELVYSKDDLMRLQANRNLLHEQAPTAGSRPRIVLLGKANLVMADVWKVGGQVVAQVARPTMDQMSNWSEARRNVILGTLLQRYHADVIWVAMTDGSLAMIAKN